MRTTLIIDDALLKRAKQRAARDNTTVSAIVNQALRETLSEPASRSTARFEMIVFGQEQSAVHHEPVDFARALEDDDQARLRR